VSHFWTLESGDFIGWESVSSQQLTRLDERVINVNVDEREGTFTPRQMFYLLHLSLIIFATLGVWIER
jgi:hypothetical protein